MIEYIYNSLHNNTFVFVVIIALLVMASFADNVGDQDKKPAATRVVDNVGSWLAYAALIVLLIIYVSPVPS